MQNADTHLHPLGDPALKCRKRRDLCLFATMSLKSNRLNEAFFFFFTIFKVAELAKEITRSKRVRIATDAVIIEDESQPKKKAKKGTGRKQKKQPNVII